MSGHCATHLEAGPGPAARSDVGLLPCEDRPPGTFFPPDERPWTDAPDPGVYAELLRLCAGCCWRDRCLALALVRREAYGVWGGTTPAERARIHLDALLPSVPKARTGPAALALHQ